MPFDATPVTNPVIEALREGRERVERGWCQGVGHDRETNSYCLLGSLASPRGEALNLLRKAGGIRTGQMAEWNDAPDRTQADVLALFDRAIELAVAEEMENRNG